ncbi:ArdC family protein [Sphingobium yanoikuyae]|uniref:ArdC family protein n=1 Tax=Sphingobium yanoikuyae TaxID=13690 RepID=UPI00241EC067|nr:zincin-like metallopeptidase domain-containing protein [Sphingobium yanoikuyae]
MGHQDKGARSANLYTEVTERIIAQLEAGSLPWVQPWGQGEAAIGLPRNAGTGRCYSGINILILWYRLFEKGYRGQRWLTYRQAQTLGGHVRRGEEGVSICYADRFVPRGEEAKARDEDREARQVAFLKRFTVFNVDQCEDLPEDMAAVPLSLEVEEIVPLAHRLIRASGADIRVGGEVACYAPSPDYIRVPPQSAYHDRINWYRTIFHELGHWTGHVSRLDRLTGADFGSDDYAREELCAEMASAFLCAELGIEPTVRHADYIAAWLTLLHSDNRAIFRAASQASKAADYLLAFDHLDEADEGAAS